MSATIVGIDNGATGTIGILKPDCVLFFDTPIKEMLQGKAGRKVKRVDHKELTRLLLPHVPFMAYIERPYTGQFMSAMLPGQRSFEAVLIVLEQLGCGFEVIDSKVWQEPVLGKIKGSAALKQASAMRGAQIYPQYASMIKKHKDADGLLIAHHFYHNHA
jgi:hypothetical protein